MDIMTLGELKERCKERSDLMYSNFVDDTEWIRLINDAIKKVYEKLSLTLSGNFHTKSMSFQMSQGNGLYDLPTDFFNLCGVDANISGATVTLEEFQFSERNRYNNVLPITYNGTIKYRWMLLGNQLMFKPTPNDAMQITIWYNPVPNKLVNDSDSIDFIMGYYEYAISWVGRLVAAKQEQDITPWSDEIKEHEKIIDKMKNMRQIARPIRISDVRRLDYSTTVWGIDR